MWLVDTLQTCWVSVSGWFSQLSQFFLDHWKIVGIFSAISLVLSLVGCAAMIIYLPEDYFNKSKQVRHIKNPILRFFISVLKNIVGGILIIVGALLAVPGIPGQGLLTILAGLIISDFPGKKRLAWKIIRIRGVYLSANKIRARFNRPPLQLDAQAKIKEE